MAEVNEAKREKSQVEDINRSLYDFRYEEKDAYKVDAGLTPAIVEQISCGNGEGLLIKKGEVIRKVPEDQLLDTLRYELEHWGE